MAPSERLNAQQLLEAFRVAEQWLALNREAVNAINVYPVPDGDTGTNMLLTLRATIAAADPEQHGLADGTGVGEVMRTMARGALLGARGNSGVILSQMFSGLADALEDAEEIDGEALCDALTAAARAAYDAVGDPVEGTMLTVMREAAEAAARSSAPTIAAVLDAAVTEAHASVERTPTLLPRLAEAGVVDAGGLGVAVLLAGLRYGYLGEELPEPMPVPAGAVEMGGVEHEGHGYCTEFVVVGRALERAALAAALDDMGGASVLVVGDTDVLHVHVHVEDPGPALSAGAAAGALEAVKIENMQAQHDKWAAGHNADPERAPAELPELGLVAVAQGHGLAAAFRELGAGQIVDGGATNNPSAGELLEAARRAGREHVFLLPNDPNVILAAEQAASQAPGFITVVPARSIAAGLAAAISYAPEGDPTAVAEQMHAAIEGVHTVEVTRSVRDTTADGVTVAEGDAIVIVDGRLVARAATLEEAMLAGLARVAGDAELVTVYLGADAAPDARETVERLIAEACPQLEIEVVNGGQPHYPYILGIE